MTKLTDEILENYEQVVREGHKIVMNFPNANVSEFAEKLLLIVNWKSNYKNLGITDIRTFYGTNYIQVTTYNKEGCYDMAKQLVENYDHIKIEENCFKYINVDFCGLSYDLENGDVIEEDEEVVYVGCYE